MSRTASVVEVLPVECVSSLPPSLSPTIRLEANSNSPKSATNPSEEQMIRTQTQIKKIKTLVQRYHVHPIFLLFLLAIYPPLFLSYLIVPLYYVMKRAFLDVYWVSKQIWFGVRVALVVLKRVFVFCFGLLRGVLFSGIMIWLIKSILLRIEP
jgi:hypothetical protein